MVQNYVSEIIPGLFLGGEYCGSFILSSYPEGLEDLDNDNLIYGDYPSVKKPEDVVSFNSRTDSGIFDVVVSGNIDYGKKIPRNENRSTPEAFLKEGGKHILAIVIEENFNDKDFVVGVDQAISALKEGKSVYVHCAQGCDRSATVVIAMLHKMTELSEETIIKFVASKRMVINHFDTAGTTPAKNFQMCMAAVKESMDLADS